MINHFISIGFCSPLVPTFFWLNKFRKSANKYENNIINRYLKWDNLVLFACSRLEYIQQIYEKFWLVIAFALYNSNWTTCHNDRFSFAQAFEKLRNWILVFFFCVLGPENHKQRTISKSIKYGTFKTCKLVTQFWLGYIFFPLI